MQTAFFVLFFLFPHAPRVVMMIIKVQSSSILSYVKGLECSDRHVLSCYQCLDVLEGDIIVRYG